jgi:precorrin-2 methylase
MFAKAVNTLLRAKLVYNKQKEVYKIIAAFNVTEQTDKGAYKFPVKKDFTSGEFVYETLEKDKQRIIKEMQKQCRTANIEFV